MSDTDAMTESGARARPVRPTVAELFATADLAALSPARPPTARARQRRTVRARAILAVTIAVTIAAAAATHLA